MARNPDRIPEILEELRKHWEKTPDQRFYQLLDNLQYLVGIDGRIDMYFYEDEQLLLALQHLNGTRVDKPEDPV